MRPVAEPSGARPIAAAEFAGLIERFAPFERAPHLAVAVSGGADSLALVLLADEWARAAGGAITALTVDHRLRLEAAAEAAQVAAWLGARGVAHRTLVRTGPTPSGDVQAMARAARYQLLEGWCEAQGVLHLLTAHQREDQAETVLLRLARGSGLDGLAGMAAEVEHRACRVLRPLLGTPRDRLVATLTARDQGWIEDPSNLDPAYARVRLRRAAPLLAAEGLSAERLADAARLLGRARIALEGAVAACLAETVWLHPAGFAWLTADRLLAAPDEVALRALAAVIATVSGASYPPRLEALERLHRDVRHAFGAGRTLGGCRVLPRRGRILVCREAAAVEAPVAAPPGEAVSWDGRFVLRLPANAPHGLALGAMGLLPGAAELRAEVPAAARPTLPALHDAAGIVAVPHLEYLRKDTAAGALAALTVAFRPTRPLARGDFTVV